MEVDRRGFAGEPPLASRGVAGFVQAFPLRPVARWMATAAIVIAGARFLVPASAGGKPAPPGPGEEASLVDSARASPPQGSTVPKSMARVRDRRFCTASRPRATGP